MISNFHTKIYPLLDDEHYRTVAIYRPSVSAHDLLGPVI